MSLEKAVILCSFGSSNIEGIEESIGLLKNDIEKMFNYEIKVVISFTSRVIVEKLKSKGYYIDNLNDALEKLYMQKIKEVIIQPLYIMNGNENVLFEKNKMQYSSKFKRLIVNSNLLQGERRDFKEAIKCIVEIISTYDTKGENILIVGHGSKINDNYIYEIIANESNKNSKSKIYMATLEGKYKLEKTIKEMSIDKVKNIMIVPIFLIKGKHIIDDICKGKNSWKNDLEDQGFKVRFKMKSLLEYEKIRRIYLEKIKFSDNLQKQ